MIEPQHLLEIIDFTMQTWNLDESHKGTLHKEFSILIENCISEHICAIDYNNKTLLDELRAAHNQIKKGLKVIENQYTHDYSSLTFLDSQKLLTNTGDRSQFLSMHPEIMDVIKINESLNESMNTFSNWLEKQKPNYKPQKYAISRMIIRELYSLYKDTTGLIYKGKQDSKIRGQRIHTPFTKVAILIDALYGTYRPELSNLKKIKNNKLNISGIVDDDDDYTNNFCRLVETEIK